MASGRADSVSELIWQQYVPPQFAKTAVGMQWVVFLKVVGGLMSILNPMPLCDLDEAAGPLSGFIPPGHD